MRVADWVFGLLLLIGAGLIFQRAATFAAMPGQDYGPSLVPRLVAAGFAACGVVLLVGGIRAKTPAFALDDEARTPGRLQDAALTIGAIVAMMLLWDTVGFLILSTLVLTGLIWRYWQGRFLTALSIGLIGSVVIDWMFRKMLLVPLPLGPFSGWIW